MTQEITKVVLIGSDESVARVIAALPGPAPAAVLAEIEPLIEADAQITAAHSLRPDVEALARARADEEYARGQAAASRARAGEVDRDLRSAESGSLVRASIGVVGFVTCFVAEYGISLATLPFLLDIDPTTFVGMMLAAAPPAALAVFDVLLAELLEEPWQRLKNASRSWRRSVLWGVRVATLVALVVGNLFMLRDVAAAREEAVRVKEALAAAADADRPGAAVVINRGVIDRAVLSVSIWVSLDGALFLLFGLHDARREGRRLTLRFLLWRYGRQQRRLDRELHTRVATRETRQHQVDDAPLEEARIAEWTRRAHRVRLQMKQLTPKPRMSSLERVNQSLSSAI